MNRQRLCTLALGALAASVAATVAGLVALSRPVIGEGFGHTS